MIRRRILVIVAVALVIAVSLPAGMLLFLTRTEAGLRFIVAQVPERIGRAGLAIGPVQGTLAHGMRVGYFEVEHERVRMRFESISGRLELLPLLAQTISVTELSAADARVEVRRRVTPPVKYTPRFLPRLLRISVDEMRVGHALLVAPNGTQLEGTQLYASGIARHKSIRFYDASVIWNRARIEASGELRAADPMQMTVEARLDLRAPGEPPWVIAAQAEGDLDTLGVRGRFAEPFRASFDGRAFALTRAWRWSGKAIVQDFDLKAWGAGDALGRITGELDVSGNREGFRAQGPLIPEGLQAGEFLASFEGFYAERTVRARRIDITHRASQARVTGNGEIAIVEKGPRLALRGTWSDFRWPLVGDEVAFRSATGEYTLTGLWPYALTAIGQLAPGRLPAMKFDLQGALAKQSLTIDAAQVEALGGRAAVTGAIGWSPEETWSLAGKARGIDPAAIRPDMPGKLDFAFEASGEGFGDEGDFRLALRELGGRLRGVPARGGGALARRDGAWEFTRVRVSLGRTDLSLDGRLAQRLELQFAIQAEDLSLLAARSRGQLRARGTVRGTSTNPIVDVVATGSDLEHEGLKLASFTADVDFDARSDAQAHVALRAVKLQIDGRTIERIRFDLDGAASGHDVRLAVRATGLDLQARAEGSFADGVWRGRVEELSVSGEESLDLALEKPVELVLSRQLARLEFICVGGVPARICSDAQWNPSRWAATLSASELPLATLTAGLTPTIEYRGTVNVVARGFGNAGEPLQGDLRADLIDAQLRRRTPSGREDTITFGSGHVLVTATREAIQARATLDAQEIGTIRGELNARRTVEEWRRLPLRGNLHAETGELDLLSLYVPQIDRAAGKLLVDLDFAGTLGAPLVSGLVRVSDAELDFYQVNLSMRKVGLEARLLDNGLDFSGAATIGTGAARASGRVEWRQSLPYGRVRLTGERLQVANIPEAFVYATPDLEFAIEGRRIAVTGEVHVPEARLVPADLADAVRASSDEIIVTEGRQEPRELFSVTTVIKLSLGEDVTIDTTGLTGRLTGSITTRTGFDEIARATGELRVEEGEYTAYGRRLDIERGRLVFTGGPVQNPGVDIRAVKEFPDVKAGVIVRGTLLQPRLTFFSEPPLPQSQIVSLILAGGSLAAVQDRPAGERASSASDELLAQGGAILAQQLGSRIGLEDVSIESNLANETSLVLGKYLSPRFYVSYGISLTEALNTLKLRYSLSDHWTIRSELGEDRSADLVYTIEK